MANFHKMRWRDKDVEEMYRVVKNFNQKITYHFKNNPEKRSFLPSKASVKDIRKKTTTRKDFNRILNHYKRFSRRGMEDIVTNKGGTTMTKWKLKEAKIQARIRNIKIAYRDKSLDVKKPKGYLPSDDRVVAKPLDIDKIDTLGEEEFEKFVEATEKRLGDDYYQEGFNRYKENYLKGISTQLNNNSDLRKMVEELDNQELFELTVQNPKLKIKFMYDDQQKIETRIKYIKEELIRGMK